MFAKENIQILKWCCNTLTNGNIYHFRAELYLENKNNDGTNTFMRNKHFLPYTSLSLSTTFSLPLSIPLLTFVFLFHYQFSYFPSITNFLTFLPALIIIGTEYVRRSSGVDTGLSDLVDRVGLQTGLYGGKQVEDKIKRDKFRQYERVRKRLRGRDR